MKCISVWNPWASLIVHGHKTIETRPWKPDVELIGQRIGIASTKMLRPEQRREIANKNFQRFYADTGLPDLDALPNGYLLGSALLEDIVPVTEALIERLHPSELSFGWFTPGRYAWRLSQPRPFKATIAVRGNLGLWAFPDESLPSDYRRECDGRPADHRGDLSDQVGRPFVFGAPSA